MNFSEMSILEATIWLFLIIGWLFFFVLIIKIGLMYRRFKRQWKRYRYESLYVDDVVMAEVDKNRRTRRRRDDDTIKKATRYRNDL